MSTFVAKYDGRTAWIARPIPKHEVVKCPDCLGARRATVTLGNGKVFAINCELCARHPGTVQQSTYRSEPVEVECKLYEIRPGEEPRYTTIEGGLLPESRIFETREEAQVEADRKTEEFKEKERSRLLHNINQGRERYAWSVHYWRRQRAERVKEIARIDERIQEIKEKG